MENLIMSRKIRVLEALKHKKLTQQQAANQLNLSRRQIIRIAMAYAEDGIDGLIHKGKGRTENRAKDLKIKKKILELAGTIYKDFGPTLMAEMLEEHDGIKINRESLRQLLISKGLWEAKPKKQAKQHVWRPPKDCFGNMLQADASKHLWFGDGYTTLLTLIDDATNTAMMLFVPEECTEGYKKLLEQWVRTYGILKAFYSDRHQIFVGNSGRSGTPDSRFTLKENPWSEALFKK
ncbi:helix-turn-helix domain-containing protein [Candidatus Dependentiae bacterium]|nr:helix-turn-helix domain-containing protein [Candidatus Dependentiae bacterium]